MNKRRIDDLFTYLHALTRLANAYKCYDEIGEAIAEIRREIMMGYGDEVTKVPEKLTPMYQTISDAPTSLLTDELAKREGVKEYVVDAHRGSAFIKIDNGLHGQTETVEGPARILVNMD